MSNEKYNKNPQEVWDSLSIRQKHHFMKDHKSEFKPQPEYAMMDWNELPAPVQKSITRHVADGKYKFGGNFSSAMKKAGESLKKGFETAKEKTKEKVHEAKKDNAVKVLDATEKKVSGKEKETVKEAKKIVKKKFDKGGNAVYHKNMSKKSILSKTIVYDNNGETLDRYTVFTPDGSVFGMSENASGFNQYIGDKTEVEKGSHLGKKLKSVPKEIEWAVLDRMKEQFSEGGLIQGDSVIVHNFGMMRSPKQGSFVKMDGDEAIVLVNNKEHRVSKHNVSKFSFNKGGSVKKYETGGNMDYWDQYKLESVGKNDHYSMDKGDVDEIVDYAVDEWNRASEQHIEMKDAPALSVPTVRKEAHAYFDKKGYIDSQIVSAMISQIATDDEFEMKHGGNAECGCSNDADWMKNMTNEEKGFAEAFCNRYFNKSPKEVSVDEFRATVGDKMAGFTEVGAQLAKSAIQKTAKCDKCSDKMSITDKGNKFHLTYIDSTHFYLSNNEDRKGEPYHIGQIKGEPYYNDVRDWLIAKTREKAKK